MPAPARPAHGGDIVDVWRADLDSAEKTLCELLCERERERAARLHNQRDKGRWSASRAILRSILARHIDCDPRALRFELGEHGKPRLAGAVKLCFNLSHSGPIALYAVSASRDVGIDVELARPNLNELALAARVLGDGEAQRLKLLDAEARTIEFLRAWVTHEAAVKCIGSGLGSASEQPSSEELSLKELDVGPTAAAALALKGPECEVRCWQWGPQPL